MQEDQVGGYRVLLYPGDSQKLPSVDGLAVQQELDDLVKCAAVVPWRFAEDEDLGRPDAEADGERIGEVALGVKVTLGHGRLLGDPQCRASGQDRDFGYRVGVLGEDGNERMAGFMDCNGANGSPRAGTAVISEHPGWYRRCGCAG